VAGNALRGGAGRGEALHRSAMIGVAIQGSRGLRRKLSAALFRAMQGDAEQRSARQGRFGAFYGGDMEQATLNEQERLMTVNELAQRLRLNRRTIERYSHSIPNFPRMLKIGGASRFREAEVNQYIRGLGK
jgi:predicted DNA-binding transcriptional regulator AlpA